MNKKNIDKLIEHLKTLSPDQFHMRDCQRCIGGYARKLWPREEGRGPVGWHLMLDLDISEFQANEIAYGYPPGVGLPEAIRLLRNLKKTGKVDWDYAMGGEK